MIRTAKFLLIFTIAYNVLEGIIAVLAGIAAGSIALVAFGADSYLEIAAASLVLWRLSALESDQSEQIEEQVERFIGWTFLALATVVIVQAVINLIRGEGASESPIGIILAIASIIVMPGVALWKLRVAAYGNIRSVAAEAKETLACSYLSVTLLIGLVANATIGWWWLDAVTALLLVPWLIREGLEGMREDEERTEPARLCSCRSCLYGLRGCAASCCAP